MKKLFLFFGLLLYVSILSVFAQEMNTIRITTEDGLPSLEVRDIYQDEKGFIWIAHRTGVSVYDGIRFRTYNQKHGFEHPFQSFLCPDPKGNLFSLSDDREINISKLINDFWVRQPSPDSVASQTKVTGFEILRTESEPGYSIAFSTKNHGFYYYDSVWHHYPADTLQCTYIHDLTVYQDEYILATDKGLIHFREGRFSRQHNEALKDNLPVYALYSSKNTLVTVSPISISIFNNWQQESYCYTRKTIDWDINNTAVQVITNNDSIVFVGDETQFYQINISNCKISEIDTKTGFTAEGVTSLFYDDHGIIWAASNRGISTIHPSAFTNFSIENILPDNEVSAIIKSEPGTYLLGQNMVISEFRDNKITRVIKLSDDQNYNVYYRVQDFTSDGKGNIYFASSKGGFGHLKDYKVSWLDHPEFRKVNYFSSVLYDTTTNRLWCAANGLFGYLTEENEFVKIETGIPDINIRKIFKLSDGNIYCGLNKNGFIKIDSLNYTTPYYFDEGSVEDNNVFSMHLDSSGLLWIGTTVGLNYYYENGFHSVLEGYPAINSPVYQINEDNNGSIWIGTEVSVLRFYDNTLIEYTESEGYRSGETNRDAFVLTDDDKILIGGSSGLSVFDLKNINQNTVPSPPNCEITALKFNNQDLDPYKSHYFAYNENSFLITFTPISFSGRKNIIQQIMLAGLDDEWQTITDKHTSSAFYSSLPAGTYNFLYRVSNNNGRSWCRAKISGNIYIAEPFYTKWWFIGAIAIFIIALFALIFYLITKRRYSKALEAEVEKRTTELQKSNNEKDKFFSIIAHDLKSPFNAIIGFADILKNDYDSFTEDEKKLFVDNIHESSHSTFKLIEKLLDWSRAKTGRLKYNPVSIDLSTIGVNMINTYRNAASKKNIVIKSHIGYHSKVYADKDLLETIFRNLISNAIKFTNPHGEIILNAKKEGDFTRISITDNGVGISEENLEKIFSIDVRSSTKGTEEESGTGLGLLVVKEFVETNGGTIQVSSTPGKGSEFSFTVPSKMSEE
ncbi:MAG: hypothetical protein C0593_06485 [Marinilabiliales bacterium]|nr:MAG: hypothetical protein C0593_06485 [Marinilabiliales bacterium]